MYLTPKAREKMLALPAEVQEKLRREAATMRRREKRRQWKSKNAKNPYDAMDSSDFQNAY